MFNRENFLVELKKNLVILDDKEFVEYKDVVRLLDITILRSYNSTATMFKEVESLIKKLQKTDLECKEC